MGEDADRGISSWFSISSIRGSRTGFRGGERLARGGEHTDDMRGCLVCGVLTGGYNKCFSKGWNGSRATA